MTMSADAKASESEPIGLDSLRWKYRVIVIHTTEPSATHALANLEEHTTEIDERDIAWFLLGDSALYTNYDGNLDDRLRDQLMERFFTPVPTGTAVLLIGKDGTLKSRTPDLDLEATFGLIDQMPMRREEMQRAGKGPG